MMRPGDHYIIRDPMAHIDGKPIPVGFAIYGEVIEPPPDWVLPDHARWVRAYSVECPAGELGTIAVDDPQPVKITPEQFEAARAAGWPEVAHVE